MNADNCPMDPNGERCKHGYELDYCHLCDPDPEPVPEPVQVGPDTPVELLEAQRRIKAAQVQIIKPAAAKSLDSVLQKLRISFANAPTIVPDARADQRDTQAEIAAKIANLRENWNAPRRHVERTNFNTEAPEWIACLESITVRLGTGLTIALVGRRGPGKTQLAVELMRATTAQRRSAYYCTAMDYFMRVKDAFHPDRTECQASSQKFFVKPRLLVIDEMNVRSDSAWEDNMLADLIGKRYNALLDTVLVSNETAEAFEKSVGPSIIDRLNETGGVVECGWRSFRA